MFEKMLSDELVRGMTGATVLKMLHTNLSCRIGEEYAAGDRALQELDDMIADMEAKNAALMAKELGIEPAVKIVSRSP